MSKTKAPKYRYHVSGVSINKWDRAEHIEGPVSAYSDKQAVFLFKKFKKVSTLRDVRVTLIGEVHDIATPTSNYKQMCLF